MAFFFSKGRQSNRVELTCPDCGHVQEEPSLMVSTICRGCGTHLRIQGGKAVAPYRPTFKVPAPGLVRPGSVDTAFESDEPVGSSDSSDSVAQTPAQELPVTTNEELMSEPRSAAPSLNESAKPESSVEPVVRPTLAEPVTPSASATPEKTVSPRPMPTFVEQIKETPDSAWTKVGHLFKEQKGERQVVCFDCSHVHKTPLQSSSALCPKCGTYISLRDYEIRESWSQRIQTRGNVFIHKKGVVQSATIRCHHLTVDGVFMGGAECSGSLTISNHGKIMGRVQCDKLVVEKKARVEFLNEVIANEVSIDGEVQGNIHCQGKLSLLKKATLVGDIRVGTLMVAEGAKHTGQISMGTSS